MRARKVGIAGWMVVGSLLVGGCATAPQCPDPAWGPEQAAATCLPDSFAPEWSTEDPAAAYDSGNLYNHIDGEAELYFPYGFAWCVTRRYVCGEDSISADIYAMGSRLDAFGIYSNYRYPQAQFPATGAECFASPHQLMFYQDRFFVRLTAVGNLDGNEEALMILAKTIENGLPGDADPPPELALLEIPEVEPGSVGYVAESLLGYAFFPRGLIADARADAPASRLFVVMLDSPEAARQALDVYAQALDQAKAPHESSEGGLAAEDPLHGRLCIRAAGSYLCGATRAADAAQGMSLAGRLAEGILSR